MKWTLLTKWKNIDANIMELACSIYLYFFLLFYARFLYFHSQTLLWLCWQKKTKFAAINELGNKYDGRLLFNEMRIASYFFPVFFFFFFAWYSPSSVFLFVFATKSREHINCSRRLEMYHFLFFQQHFDSDAINYGDGFLFYSRFHSHRTSTVQWTIYI